MAIGLQPAAIALDALHSVGADKHYINCMRTVRARLCIDYTYKRHEDARGKRLNQAMKNDYMENGGPNGIAENRSARKAVMLLGRFCRFSSQTGPS